MGFLKIFIQNNFVLCTVKITLPSCVLTAFFNNSSFCCKPLNECRLQGLPKKSLLIHSLIDGEYVISCRVSHITVNIVNLTYAVEFNNILPLSRSDCEIKLCKGSMVKVFAFDKTSISVCIRSLLIEICKIKYYNFKKLCVNNLHLHHRL